MLGNYSRAFVGRSRHGRESILSKDLVSLIEAHSGAQLALNGETDVLNVHDKAARPIEGHLLSLLR